MPLSTNIGGQAVPNKCGCKEDKYLTEEQARNVCKKIESGSIINTDILQQEIEQEQDLRRMDNTSRDVNPYRKMIVNNAEKIETVLTQMEQWSILSNVINYIQYDKHPKNYHSLNIGTVNKEKCRGNSYIKEKERDMLELDFRDTPDKLKEEYLDVYEGIQTEILSPTIFDKNSDLSTTYLGKIDRSKNNKIKVEESFPTSEQDYTMGKLLDETKYQILLDTGPSKSFMSKSHYLCCKSLHSLPKFASKTQRIQVGNFSVFYS